MSRSVNLLLTGPTWKIISPNSMFIQTIIRMANLCVGTTLMYEAVSEWVTEWLLHEDKKSYHWQWVTQRSWCQMNRNDHSSPVKH